MTAQTPDVVDLPVGAAPGQSWLLFREPTPAEVAEALDQWVSSYRNSRWAGTVPNNRFSEIQLEAVRQLLTRGARLTVAAFTERPEQLIGWICTEVTRKGEKVLHYAFTKSVLRRRGVFAQLMAHVGLSKGAVYTHKTEILDRVLPQGRFVPAIARRRDA